MLYEKVKLRRKGCTLVREVEETRKAATTQGTSPRVGAETSQGLKTTKEVMALVLVVARRVTGNVSVPKRERIEAQAQ